MLAFISHFLQIFIGRAGCPARWSLVAAVPNCGMRGVGVVSNIFAGDCPEAVAVGVAVSNLAFGIEFIICENPCFVQMSIFPVNYLIHCVLHCVISFDVGVALYSFIISIFTIFQDGILYKDRALFLCILAQFAILLSHSMRLTVIYSGFCTKSIPFSHILRYIFINRCVKVAVMRFNGYNQIKKGCDYMGIGQRIKERRKALKMSADELAKRLGKDRSTIYRYEKGDIENLPLDILEPIATALNTTPQYLMGWEQVQKNNSTIADAVVRMRVDDEFLSVVSCLLLLDSEKIKSVKQLISAFQK